MPSRITTLVPLALAATLVGCDDDGAGWTADDLVGTWGREVPGVSPCISFCDNGRYLQSDWGCPIQDVAMGHASYSVQGDTITVVCRFGLGQPDCAFFGEWLIRELDENHIELAAAGKPLVRLPRYGEMSEACF